MTAISELYLALGNFPFLCAHLDQFVWYEINEKRTVLEGNMPGWKKDVSLDHICL